MSGILIRNLKPENIKQGVEILNVKGTFEGGGSAVVNNQDITVDSSIVEQSFTAGEGYTGLGTVTVNPYTLESKSVDSSTVSQTVTTDKGLSSVTVNPYVLESKSVDSSTVSQIVTSDEDGMSSVTVNPYTLDSKTVDSSTVSQTVNSSADGMSSVTVNPYTLDSKTVNSSTVSQTVTSDEDGLSSVTVNPYTLDSKTVDSSTVSQTVNSSADGMSSVTVNPYVLEAKTVDPSTSSQTVSSSTADGMSSVTLNPVTSSIDSNISAGNIKQGVTILGVTGTMSSDSDWILDAKNGGTTLTTDTEGLCDTNSGMIELFQYAPVTSATFTNTTASGNRAFNNSFKNSSIQSVSFPNLTSVTGPYCFNLAFENCSSLQSISFPALTTINADYAFYQALRGTPSSTLTMEFPELQTITGAQAFAQVRYGINSFYPQFPKLRDVSGNNAFSNFFENASGPSNPVPYELPELRTVNGPYVMSNFCLGGRGGVSSLSLPKLEEVNRYGNYAFQGLSASNSRMRSISMPKLQYCNGSNSPFRYMWQSVSSSPGNTITTTPEFFKYTSSSDYGIQAYLGTINLVTDGYTYLGGWCPNTVMHLNFNNTYVNNNDLTDANILHILTKLGEVTDYDQVNYQVNFTARTIQDTADLDYTNVIAKLTDAGWTVTGLTITI